MLFCHKIHHIFIIYAFLLQFFCRALRPFSINLFGLKTPLHFQNVCYCDPKGETIISSVSCSIPHPTRRSNPIYIAYGATSVSDSIILVYFPVQIFVCSRYVPLCVPVMFSLYSGSVYVLVLSIFCLWS